MEGSQVLFFFSLCVRVVWGVPSLVAVFLNHLVLRNNQKTTTTTTTACICASSWKSLVLAVSFMENTFVSLYLSLFFDFFFFSFLSSRQHSTFGFHRQFRTYSTSFTRAFFSLSKLTCRVHTHTQSIYRRSFLFIFLFCFSRHLLHRSFFRIAPSLWLHTVSKRKKKQQQNVS